MGFKLTTLVVIGTDCTCSCHSNYHDSPWGSPGLTPVFFVLFVLVLCFLPSVACLWIVHSWFFPLVFSNVYIHVQLKYLLKMILQLINNPLCFLSIYKSMEFVFYILLTVKWNLWNSWTTFLEFANLAKDFCKYIHLYIKKNLNHYR